VMLAAVLATGPLHADTVLLRAPEPAYPTLLSRSCGGVHVSTYATGFDASGHVTGLAHAWTRCPAGTGRYRRTRLYESWHSLVWDLSGTVLAMRESAPTSPDPEFTATDSAGSTVATRRASTHGAAAYSAVLTTP